MPVYVSHSGVEMKTNEKNFNKGIQKAYLWSTGTGARLSLKLGSNTKLMNLVNALLGRNYCL